MMKYAASLLPLTLVLAQPALAQADDMGASLADASTQAMPYLAIAGMSDVFEITSSQIALQRSTNPQVRQYAQMLIDHHTRTTNASLVAAKAAGLMPPPPVLDAQRRALIDQLLAAAPADFDRVYLSQQVPSHEMALTLQQGYAANGDKAPLKAGARRIVPVVQQHLAQARTMLGAL